MFWVCHMFNIFFQHMFTIFSLCLSIYLTYCEKFHMFYACSTHFQYMLLETYFEHMLKILLVYTVFRNLEFIWFDTLRTIIHINVFALCECIYSELWEINIYLNFYIKPQEKTLIKIYAENSLTTRPSR